MCCLMCAICSFYNYIFVDMVYIGVGVYVLFNVMIKLEIHGMRGFN
jgi:hypothetical protein